MQFVLSSLRVDFEEIVSRSCTASYPTYRFSIKILSEFYSNRRTNTLLCNILRHFVK